MITHSSPQILQKNIPSCDNHSTFSHLFIHPFCPLQTQAKKIIALFAFIVTLGIPAAINFLYITISKKRMLSLVSSIKSNEGFPPIDEQAIQFVKQSLLERPTIASTYIVGGGYGFDYYQPTNQSIPKLISLYFIYKNELIKTINKEKKRFTENLWNSEEVQKAADSYMKTAYVISLLTLHDMPSFTKYLSQKGKKRTNYQALIEQDSYAYRTFFFCSLAYHLVRQGYLFPIAHSTEKSSLYPRNPGSSISENQSDTYRKHATKFYQNGTIQKKWTVLYNDFCQAVNPTVVSGEDTRFEKWSKEDLSEEYFQPIPDTLPT